MTCLARLTLVAVLCLLAGAQSMAEPVPEGEATSSAPSPKVGLALGSGGAAGLAHIAMLEVFDDLALVPDRIAGTSVGAVIGALYAAGLSAAEIHDIFDDFGGSRLDLLSRLMRPGADLTLRRLISFDSGSSGVIDSQGFLDFLATRIEARTFADLRIPLAVIATDYWSGETVILSEGDLFEALKASMAVPGLFTPLVRENQLLVDGGVSNPLPWDLLQADMDIVVAVDVTGSRKRVEGERPDLTEMLFKTFEIMQQSIIRARMEHARPSILIRPEIQEVRLLEFNRIEQILAQSKPAAAELRQALEAELATCR